MPIQPFASESTLTDLLRAATLTLALGAYTSSITLAQDTPAPAPMPAPTPQQIETIVKARTRSTPPTPAPPQTPLAFRNVTVVDVTNGKLLPDQTVLVTGNRIGTIGPAATVAIPDSTLIINAEGKFLIPGMWDMHVHIDERVGWYPLLIANGVTGVREMAQRFRHGTDSFRVWQREVMEGKRIGPRSYGPSADLTNANGITIKSVDDVPHIVDSLKQAGVVFLKYHDDNGDPDIFFAIAREARRVGLPLVGHLTEFVSDVEASDSGVRSVEHAQESHQCWQSFPGWPEPPDSPFAKKRCDPVAKAFIKNGTWLTPTLVVFYYQDEGHTQDAQMFLQTMHSLGLRKILAGSDASQNGNILGVQLNPGFSLLQEVVLLVGGGLSPLEAIQSATLNPAKFIGGTDSLGTVTEGKLADLVLLDANPVADIRNILKVRAVVANGRYFDRPILDAMDPDGVRRAKVFADQQAAVVAPATNTHAKPSDVGAPTVEDDKATDPR